MKKPKPNGDLLIKLPSIHLHKTPKQGRSLYKDRPLPTIHVDPHSNPRESAITDSQTVSLKLDLSFAKYIILFLAVATGIAGSIVAIYSYNKFANPDTLGVSVANIKSDPSEKEIKDLVIKVSQIAILPTGELPEVLVINDLTQMRANPFFASASLGDYILIYKKAGRIIVYNPNKNKIVNMGPYVGGSTKEATPSAKPAGPSEQTASPPPSGEPQPSPTPPPAGGPEPTPTPTPAT